MRQPKNGVREEMRARTPERVQPFLTWLTALPYTGQAVKARTPTSFALETLGWLLGGVALSAYALTLTTVTSSILLLVVGMLATTGGLGMCQVVLFHHAAPHTVLKDQKRNESLGRILSTLCWFPAFAEYRRMHLQHHRASVILSDEDEFEMFVVGELGLVPGTPYATPRRRVWCNICSPWFHARFTWKRIMGAWGGTDLPATQFGIVIYGGVAALIATTDTWTVFICGWIIPLTVFLNTATVLRILCKHLHIPGEKQNMSPENIIAATTMAVFPGTETPNVRANMLRGVCAWIQWWLHMVHGGIVSAHRCFSRRRTTP